ncbi:hypothetical protein PN466_20935 [Roseofilum reptotaenium CS-1145]|nr:hypothetical protein [Roseofilum reptotaenium]MDB9519413.1 hypothetical protein [Roseofilum reptotaenium CS-1145]
MMLHLTTRLSNWSLYSFTLLGLLTDRSPTLGQMHPTPPLNLPQALQLTIDGVSSLRNPHLYDQILTIESPQTFTDPSQWITVGCSGDEGNVFVVKGRGGLPEDPTQTLNPSTLWSDLRFHLPGENPPNPDDSRTSFQRPQPILEAQGWIVNHHSNIELVADSLSPPAQLGISSQPCQ